MGHRRDAWLADPRDAGVYGRLVTAIEARRQYLQPTLDEAAAMPSTATASRDTVDTEVQVRSVGDDLSGDPVEVLARLRRGVG